MSKRLRDLTLRQLRSLAALATGGSITAAAGKIGLTQPAVTLQLRALQDSAGLPLMQRSGNGMLLTEAGEELLSLYARIEAAVEACETSLDMMAGRSGGHVSIGAVSTAEYFVPFAIAAFSKRHPGIKVNLRIGNREEIRQTLRGYDVDFVIMGRPPQDMEIEHHLIGDHPHVVVAPRGHPLIGVSGLSIGDLARETLLTREPGSGTRTLMEQLFEGADPPIRIGMELSSNESIKQAVIAGLGIAFISAHTVAPELADGRLSTLDVAGLPVIRQWLVVRRADKILLPPAQAMLDFLRQEGASFLPSLA
ncbi:LysR family transcriptional regulator [Telmatospirillum siberiense]|uniref:HTH-type transcriptional regulator CbbR n=1 Tax=Telmatospirillum siberiense TaxID=382514 RepID=A0A2N3PXU7_9PROT|nr:LysR family transcriptional regulator [Telmatospirillum siberiense]PKU25191.1 LysR family transcriptional regulator [Telmatospirillum siberiense]